METGEVKVLKEIRDELRDMNKKLSSIADRDYNQLIEVLTYAVQKFGDLSLKVERSINELKYISSLLTQSIDEVYDEISSPDEEKITDPTARKVYRFIKAQVRKTGEHYFLAEDIANALDISESDVIDAIAYLINIGVPLRMRPVQEEGGKKSEANQ